VGFVLLWLVLSLVGFFPAFGAGCCCSVLLFLCWPFVYFAGCILVLLPFCIGYFLFTGISYTIVLSLFLIKSFILLLKKKM
jgi:hypothetical protein